MPLQFNMAQLMKGGVGETRTCAFEADEPLDLDDSAAHAIQGTVKFTLTNLGIVAFVRGSAVLDLACARCLEPFETPTEFQFDEEYEPVIDITTGLPLTAPRAESAFPITSTHTVDLREALRQQLLLAVDIIPVCDIACRGLCPTCGVNRNEETCNCQTAVDANPFAALQSLLTNQEGTTKETV